MRLQVASIDTTREMETLKESWDELYENISPPQGHPFNCFSWLFPYAKLLEGRGSTLQIFTVLEGHKVLGIVPLQIIPMGVFGLKIIRFIGHVFSDYCDLICCQDHEKVVTEALVKHWRSIFGSRVIFDLRGFHESSLSPSLLHTAVHELGGQIYEIPWEKAPALNLTHRSVIQTDRLEAILSKHDCGRRIKQMEKLGNARFLTLSPEDGLESHLERMFCYHILRWHEKKTYVHSMNEDMQEIYSASISQMVREGRGEIFVLIVNDLPYGYAVVLKKDKYLYYLMPTHNIFAHYSPGLSLLYHIFRYMKNAGYRELDFTIGEESYKTRFSNIVRQNRRVIFTFNSSGAFAKTMKLIDDVRSTGVLIQHIRSWRARSHRVNYTLRDYLSRRLAQLKRLDYKGINLSLRTKPIFSKQSCLIYKLALADISYPNPLPLKNDFRTQRVSVLEAIKFTCRLHNCSSPAIWGDLFRRELQGAECYGTFLDNELIHTAWVADQKNIFINEIGEPLNLEEGECCIFDCNTISEYRGHGAYPQTLMYIAKLKKLSGCISVYIYTLSSNVSSIRGIEKTGFGIVEVREPKANSVSRFCQ